MDSVITEILGSGPLGAIVVAAGFWIWKQQQKLNEVQEKRVEEAMKCVAALRTIASIYEDDDRDVEPLPKE